MLRNGVEQENHDTDAKNGVEQKKTCHELI